MQEITQIQGFPSNYCFSKQRIPKGLHNLLMDCGRLARRTIGIQYGAYFLSASRKKSSQRDPACPSEKNQKSESAIPNEGKLLARYALHSTRPS